MDNRPQSSRELAALERSLRDGPPDEIGYRPDAFDLGYTSAAPGATRVRILEPARGAGLGGRRRSSGAFSFVMAVALGMVLAVGGLAFLERLSGSGFGGPPVSPSAPQSPDASASPIPLPPLTETFVSPRNGFSVRHPAGWTVTPATTSWRQDVFLPIGNSALDDIRLPGVARLVVASQLLPAGQTEDEWLAAYFHPFPFGDACSNDHSTWPEIPIDGRTGRLDAAACPMPADIKFSVPDLQYDAIVFAGGRVYQIGLDGVVDLGYFEAFLATIRLDPAGALDPPASP